MGCNVINDNKIIMKESNFVFFVIKVKVFFEVLKEIFFVVIRNYMVVLIVVGVILDYF